MRHLLLLSLVVVALAAKAQDAKPGNIGPAVDRILSSTEANKVVVDDLFRFMEEGKYSDPSFPKVLGWNKVPELLRYGKSTKVLTSFPRNSISSHLEESCSEGMVALWLIESVRNPCRLDFGSLNPLCMGKNATGDYAKLSESNHKKVLAAYEAWWQKVKANPAKLGPANDPLKGTGLVWY